MTTPYTERFSRLVEDFALFDDWEDRYRYVIELGKALEPLPAEHHDEVHKVRGCASQVWLLAEWSGAPARLHMRGDSDAHIVRGLIAVLVALFEGLRPEEIAALDARAALELLGLEDHLSAQRSNGLIAMVGRIKAEAGARLAA